MKIALRTLIYGTIAFVSTLTFGYLLAGCDDAYIASQNLSKAADNFEVMRRIVFYNAWTDTYMLTIEGKCSIYDDKTGQLEVVCKTSATDYTKHFLGISSSVTYFVEQIQGSKVSPYHHRVTFKPQAIKPDIDFRGSMKDLIQNSSELNQ